MDEYNQLLKRLVKGAEYLENPLIQLEDYAKGLVLYNQLESQFRLLKERMNRESQAA